MILRCVRATSLVTLRIRSHCRRLCASAIYERPADIELPLHRMEFGFARSSGPGGQNVNKVNTKVEVRFVVDGADWLPLDVRGRLKEYEANKINTRGELVVSSQEHRTQSDNKKECISKLQEMIFEAYLEPKQREQWKGIAEKTKVIRKAEKRHRSDVKQFRGRSKDYD